MRFNASWNAVSRAAGLVTDADLDNPFWGSWRIGPDAFQRALGNGLKSESSGDSESG
jgi:hypothetical protein